MRLYSGVYAYSSPVPKGEPAAGSEEQWAEDRLDVGGERRRKPEGLEVSNEFLLMLVKHLSKAISILRREVLWTLVLPNEQMVP